MFVHSLELQSFRNHSQFAAKFTKKINFIIGRNGKGKSNILEALGYFSLLKSFRQTLDQDIVQYGTEHFFTKISYSENLKSSSHENGQSTHDVDLDHELQSASVGYSQQKGKLIKWNDKKLTRMGDGLGKFLAVFFIPSDLGILEQGWAERRRFCDIVISQMNPDYLVTLQDYNKALRHKNAMLKRIREQKVSIDSLHSWNTILAEKGHFIVERRLEFLKIFWPIFQSVLKELSGDQETWQFRYEQEVESQNLMSYFSQSQRLEISSGRSLAGPHLHKLYIEDHRKKDILQTASQGQKRSAVIALKLGQYKYIQQYTGKNAILLVDDVITELDLHRRAYFIDILKQSGQAFFTTTNLKGLEQFLGSFDHDYEVFELN